MSLAPLSQWAGTRLRTVDVLPSVDSTNAEALRRLDSARAQDGLVIVAERQFAGRGSRGRSWSHVPGKSLALTALVRWDDARSLHLATWAAVVSVTDVARALGLTAAIKWPNDALVGGRKLAGVLVETRDAGVAAWAAIGIGVNVGHEASDFAGGLRWPPTSLLAQGVLTTLLDAHQRLLDALDGRLASLAADDGEALCADFADRLGLLGRRVKASLSDRDHHGILARLDRDGTLLLSGRGGERRLHGAHVVALSADASG